MDAGETKPKRQSVSEIWQSLKKQFSSPRKQRPEKTETNWNAFSRKADAACESLCGPNNVCESQPFILGLPRHRKSELDYHHEGLRCTARAVLRSLEDEKEARAVLVDLEEGKKAKQPERSTRNSNCDNSEQRQEISGDLQAALSCMVKQDILDTDDALKERELDSHIKEEDTNQVVPDSHKQSNSIHLVNFNSSFRHLKSKLSESANGDNSKSSEKIPDLQQTEKPFAPRNSCVLSSCEHLEEHISTSDSLNVELSEVEELAVEVISSPKQETTSTILPCRGPSSSRVQSLSTTTKDSKFQTLDEKEVRANSNVNEDSTCVQDEAPLSATDEELIKIINKDVNCLQDSAIDVRYEALHSLHRALLGDFVGEVNHHSKRTTEQIDETDFQVANTGLFESVERLSWCVEEVVVKPLLKIFGDSSERCRFLSVSIIIALLQSIPQSVISLLPYILPVISSRLPIKSLPTEDPASKIEIKVVEKSEEVRLLLINLLHGLLKSSKAMILPFASDAATILSAAACDSNPEVLMETFAAMTVFGELCGLKLKPVAKQLISVVLRSLSHNRHRVRVAAVRAIHRLVLCGAHESIYELTAFRDPNSVPIRAFYHPDPKTQYLALLAGDRSIQVREQLLKTVGSWLRGLDERKEHECRLVPYLLCGFTDESPSVQDLAFQLMEEVGRQYEEENENEVKDIQIYLPEDITDLPGVAGRPLPRAFRSRPCLGARILVRSCLSVILHAIGGDLGAWTSGTKSLAVDFLHTVLVFAEEHITMHLQAVVIMLMKAFKESLIETKVSECANVVGYFVDPTAYLMIILPRITGELFADASVQQLGQAVKLLGKAMQGSPPNRLTRHIPEVCSVLSESDLMKTIQLDVSQSIVAVAKEMVRAWTEEVKDETIAIIWILLNVAGAADFCRRPALEAESALDMLATSTGMVSGDALIAAHAERILDLLPHPQFWAMRSLDVLVFCRLVRVATLVPPRIIERLFRLIVWFGRGSWDPDTKLRLIYAVQQMVKMAVPVSKQERSTGADSVGTFLEVEKSMVGLLEYFFVPCLEQLQEGIGVLRAPTLETISEIISTSSIAIPSLLARALSGLHEGEHRQEEDGLKEERETVPSDPSREALLEILESLQKSSL